MSDQEPKLADPGPAFVRREDQATPTDPVQQQTGTGAEEGGPENRSAAEGEVYRDDPALPSNPPVDNPDAQPGEEPDEPGPGGDEEGAQE